MTSALAAITNGRAWLRRSLATTDDQMRVARRVALVSGVVALACTAVLIAGQAIAVWRAPAEKSQIVELEGQTKEDAEIAAELHDERKRQTDVSVSRETRGRALAWILLLSGGIFVASGKWAMSLRPQPLPSLDDLVAVRFAPPKRGKVREQGAGAKEKKRTAGAEEVASKEPRGERGGNVAAEMVAHVSHFDRDQGNVAPEAVDLEFVDELIDRFGRGREAAIPILQAIQSHYRYLPDEALQRVCEKTEITPAQIAGTSSFYSQFRRSPVGRHVVRVCHGTACHVAGADQITQELRRHLEIPPDADTDSQRLFTLDKVACVGCCSLAPVMMIEEETAGRLSPATARQALDTVAKRT
jgi:NADH:ubiquinone oxidoreductase subunit E